MLFSSVSIGGSRYPGILGSLKEVSNLEILKLLSIIGLFYFTMGRGLAVPSCTSWPFWEPKPFHLVRVLVTQYRAKVNLSIKVSWIIIIAVGLRRVSFITIEAWQSPRLLFWPVVRSDSPTRLSKLYFDSLKCPQDGAARKARGKTFIKLHLQDPELKRRRYSSTHSKKRVFLWCVCIMEMLFFQQWLFLERMLIRDLHLLYLSLLSMFHTENVC